MLIFVDPPDQSVEPEKVHEPHIKGYIPGPSEIEILEGRAVRFIVYADDPDNDELTYDWQLDGESVSSETSYAYNPDHNSSGTHEMVVYISDGENIVLQEWTINVIDKKCDWELDGSNEDDQVIELNDNSGNINNVVDGGSNNVPSGGSSGGGGGSGQTTTTVELTTTTIEEELEENNKEVIEVTENKSPMTGNFAMIDFKYVLGSFAMTILLGLGLLKLLPLLKKKKNPKKKSKNK